MRVTRMSLDVQKVRGQWQVVHSEATLYNSNVAPEDPAVTGAVAAAHQKVLTYVNGVIGTCTQAMSAATSRYEDTAAIDFINYVQADAVKRALAGTPEASLPMLSIAAPFNKLAAIPAGDVTIRDVAGLYIYDNTLLGIVLTGAQVKAYLEKSAEYYKPCSTTGPVTADSITNANGTPDYNYDVMGGLDADLTYDIDLAKAVGSRIVDLVVCRQPGRVGRALRRGDQQLPPVGRRQLPGRRGRPGRLQPPDRDPSAAHRLGHGEQGHRPDGLLEPRLEARQQRQPDHGHGLSVDRPGAHPPVDGGWATPGPGVPRCQTSASARTVPRRRRHSWTNSGRVCQ